MALWPLKQLQIQMLQLIISLSSMALLVAVHHCLTFRHLVSRFFAFLFFVSSILSWERIGQGSQEHFVVQERIIAELQRAKRASEAPWVRKIGNPSSRENLVMTSAYDRPSERTSVQTRGEGEGRLEIFLTVTRMENSFLDGFLFRKVRKTLISVSHFTNDRSG